MRDQMHLVKIGEHGTLTLAMPDMAGRYLVVEKRDGRLIISPFDLEGGDLLCGAIANRNGQATLLGLDDGIMPQA